MKIIDKREKSIEKIRNQNLEAFYNGNLEISPTNLMNLGLNMYVKNQKLFKRELYNIFNMSNIDDNKILHPQQVEVLNILLSGNNLLLSAPTSFGKTFVALEFISRVNYNNIVFVVPTLALMNELSKKIRYSFGKKYNIVTNSFESLDEKNIFILVPERIDLSLLDEIKEMQVDLLIFDEIYKLKRKEGNRNREDKRLISLNKGYFDMVNKANQIILLGPFIKDIFFQRTNLNDNIVKYFSDFAPVFVQSIYVPVDKYKFIGGEILNGRSKLIYFESPASIYKFCNYDYLFNKSFDLLENSLTKWCDKYISSDWIPSLMLKRGIGIHHGNIPAFMRRYVEYLYNNEEIKDLLCTSTLLEGVNTPTDELIIYDSDKLSAFQANNLIGRVGRLDTFKSGDIYFFDKKLENFILGDEKYETIEIVAESKDIDELEEILYLKKSPENLSDEQRKKLLDLEKMLSLYGKNIDDLQNTEGFTVSSLLLFFNKIEELFSLLKKLYKSLNSENSKEKKKATNFRSEIIKLFMSIIPDNTYMLHEINNDSDNRVSGPVCINSLLSLNTNDIYSKINNQIKKNKDRLSREKLNMFVDYLFHLAFGYIKYELSKIVKYCNFIFDESYLANANDEIIKLLDLLNKDILRRFEVFNCEDNKYIKILLDIGIPYGDAKKIEKYIKKDLDEKVISTGKIYDYLEKNKELLKNRAKLDNVTIDLLDMIV